MAGPGAGRIGAQEASSHGPDWGCCQGGVAQGRSQRSPTTENSSRGPPLEALSSTDDHHPQAWPWCPPAVHCTSSAEEMTQPQAGCIPGTRAALPVVALWPCPRVPAIIPVASAVAWLPVGSCRLARQPPCWNRRAAANAASASRSTRSRWCCAPCACTSSTRPPRAVAQPGATGPAAGGDGQVISAAPLAELLGQRALTWTDSLDQVVVLEGAGDASADASTEADSALMLLPQLLERLEPPERLMIRNPDLGQPPLTPHHLRLPRLTSIVRWSAGGPIPGQTAWRRSALGDQPQP